jgi:hypothetical protein
MLKYSLDELRPQRFNNTHYRPGSGNPLTAYDTIASYLRNRMVDLTFMGTALGSRNHCVAEARQCISFRRDNTRAWPALHENGFSLEDDKPSSIQRRVVSLK